MRLGTIIKVWERIDKIEGLENFKGYEVNNLGEVRSLYYQNTFKSSILKPFLTNGYLRVVLSDNKKIKKIPVHRLVAMAFILNDDKKKTQINHIDENKINNKVENLEWMTPKENCNYGTRNKRLTGAGENNEKLSKKVFCLELEKVFSSTAEIKRQLNLDASCISKCCRHKKYKTVGGYHFYYIEDIIYFNNINLKEEI